MSETTLTLITRLNWFAWIKTGIGTAQDINDIAQWAEQAQKYTKKFNHFSSFALLDLLEDKVNEFMIDSENIKLELPQGVIIQE